MADPTRDALLVAVVSDVKRETARHGIVRLNGAGPLLWPFVATIMKNLTGDDVPKNTWRNRFQRAVKGLSQRQMAAVVDQVNPERFHETVLKMIGRKAPALANIPEPDEEWLPTASEITDPGEHPPNQSAWHHKAVPPPHDDDHPADHPGPERDEQLETLIDLIIKEQAVHRAMEWRRPVFTWEVPDDKPIGLCFPADSHIGSGGVDYQRLVEDFNLIRDTDGLYATHLGDWTDNFNPAVIPRAMLSTTIQPCDQWDLAEYLLRVHIGGKKNMPAAIEGNHDDFGNVSGLNECRRMFRSLGIRSLGAGGRVWVKLGTEIYKGELRHHFIYNSSLNETNSMRRMLELALGADFVWFGHLHKPTYQHLHRSEMDAHVGRSGSHKLFDYWAEQKGFKHGPDQPAPDIGMVILFPHEHRVLGYRNFRTGLHTLEFLRQGGAIPW